MARHLDADRKSEPSAGKPRAQVWPYPLDPAVGIELEQHCVVNLERAHARFSDHEAPVAVHDLVRPAQLGQSAVDRREQQAQIAQDFYAQGADPVALPDYAPFIAELKAGQL